MYHAYGDVRQSCGHWHKSIGEALACARADAALCTRRKGLFSDRKVARIDGEPLTERETAELISHEAGQLSIDPDERPRRYIRRWQTLEVRTHDGALLDGAERARALYVWGTGDERDVTVRDNQQEVVQSRDVDWTGMDPIPVRRRGAAQRRRIKCVVVRFEDIEFVALARLAAMEGESTAAYVRKAALRGSAK